MAERLSSIAQSGLDLPGVNASVEEAAADAEISTVMLAKGLASATMMHKSSKSMFLTAQESSSYLETQNGWEITGVGGSLQQSATNFDVNDTEYSSTWSTGGAPRSAREALLMEHQTELERLVREQALLLSSQRRSMLSMQRQAEVHEMQLRRAREAAALAAGAPGARVPSVRRFSAKSGGRPSTARVYNAEGKGGHSETLLELEYPYDSEDTTTSNAAGGTFRGSGRGRATGTTTAGGSAAAAVRNRRGNSAAAGTRVASAREFRAGEAAESTSYATYKKNTVIGAGGGGRDILAGRGGRGASASPSPPVSAAGARSNQALKNTVFCGR